MFKRLLPFLLFALSARAQAPSDPNYRRLPSFTTAHALVDSLGRIAAVADASARTAALDRLWNDLRAKGQVPFAVGDSVVWLFRGAATQVAWAGDMTGWQPRSAGQKLAGTDLWWRAERQPPDARLDYKIIVNTNDWRLDAANPLQQYSGTGTTNSELRMPEYRYPVETVRRSGVPAGRLGDPATMTSTALGYAVRYRVYTPPGYDTLTARLPVLYVTDGHEYASDALGALVTVLDNLIADRQAAPLIAVFVDPRDPATGTNRRASELVPPGGLGNVCNPCRADRFLTFLTDELAPVVDGAFRTRTESSARGILGTSLGGLFAAYAGKTRPDFFGRVASMSPAYWVYEGVYGLYESPQPGGQRLFLSQGTISDGNGGDRLSAILAGRGYVYTYVKRNEGHSWGHWRALEGAMLRTLFPGTAITGTTGEAAMPGLRLQVSPNPTRSATTFRWHSDGPARVRLSLFDALGREVGHVDEAGGTSGGSVTQMDTSALAAGTYLARLSTLTGAVTASFVVLP